MMGKKVFGAYQISYTRPQKWNLLYCFVQSEISKESNFFTDGSEWPYTNDSKDCMEEYQENVALLSVKRLSDTMGKC